MRFFNDFTSEAKSNTIKYSFTSLFIMLSFMITAQSITIKGMAKEIDGKPMIGVEVIEKNTDNGTVTDVEGRYSLKVKSSNSILVFNYLGYKVLEISVGSQSLIDVTMEEESRLMDDIIITGYRKETRTDVSSAISSIKTKDVEKLVVSGIEQALQGQAPGISVTQVTGSPGDDIAVRIRGAGTLGNNNPLFIVDGVPTSGNINMFAVNDIEFIEVLKDGASAAIYGSRASNGVILITTKRGKAEMRQSPMPINLEILQIRFQPITRPLQIPCQM
jgi:TonB-dependent SusC/RagA subfamily outer membrane receptor